MTTSWQIKAASFSLVIFACLINACSRHPKQEAQGYIEGRYTYVATSVSGVLKELLVTKGQAVTKGQKLFILELEPQSDSYIAAVGIHKQAVAARDVIAANLTYAKLTYERYKILLPKKAIQQAQLDNARSTYDATVAELAKANAIIDQTAATLARDKWTLQQKTGVAPADSFVFDTYYRIGEYTEESKPIISLLAPRDIKAIFYIGEGNLGSIHLNDKVEVRCNGCNKPMIGKISFISPAAEYTPPVIFSSETNEKLIFRIEAVFAPLEAVLLHPGQPVTVTYFPHG